jgi:DNA-binding GntR family transcriptional regulator
MTTPLATNRQTEADEAYAALHQAIRGGELAPGQRLVETELAARLGRGRNAVRTALARLEQDGLVERLPYKGARVRVIGEAEAVEILEARRALEGLTARHAAQHATPDDVAALRAIVDGMERHLAGGDLLGISELNGALHARILATARLPRVAKLIDNLNAQNVRHQYRTVLAPGRPSRSLAEHRAIVDAIAGGDPDAAEEAMRAHLSQVIRTLQSLRGTSRPW